MLQKRKQEKPGKSLILSASEQTAVIDWLLSLQAQPSTAILDGLPLTSPRGWDHWLPLAPCFFLALASRMASQSAPVLTLVVESVPDSIQAAETVGQPTDSSPNAAEEIRVEQIERVLRMIHDLSLLQPDSEEDNPPAWLSNPLPKTLLDQLIQTYHRQEFQTESIRKLTLSLVGLPSKKRDRDIPLAMISTKQSLRNQKVILRLCRQLIDTCHEHQLRLADKLDAIKQLAYGASHEFNNPLANIATRAQTLAAREMCPNKRHTLQTINAQAFRGFDMLSNLMQFAAPPAPRFQSVPVVPLIQQAVESVLRMSPERSPQLANVVTTDSPGETDVGAKTLIWADPEQVLTAMKALIRNALETDSHVQLSWTSTEDHWVEICIRDFGPSASPEQLSLACNPFYSGREAGRGLGFGLSLVYQIAKQHQGQLRLAALSDGMLVVLKIPTADRSNE